jgi:hypothetical protein
MIREKGVSDRDSQQKLNRRCFYLEMNASPGHVWQFSDLMRGAQWVVKGGGAEYDLHRRQQT